MSSLSRSLKVYGGWFFGLIGGFMLGFGVLGLAFMRAIVERFGVGDPHAYADLQIYCTIAIIIGLVLGAIGIYETYSSLKTTFTKPSVTSLTEKKYCRYCGIENKSDAVFCEKCGKKID
jgi:hypothetical protein